MLDNHVFSAAVLPLPSHSTVSSAAAASMVGSVVSSMVNVAVVVLLLLQASEAVNVKNGSTTEAEEKNNDQELVKTLLQKIDEQDQQLKVKTGEMNKLEDENKVLRMKVSHLEAELKRHENVMDWHKVDVIGPNKAASS